MMRKIITILILFLATLNLKAQNSSRADSLTAVNFFGTVYAVKAGNALTMNELKHIIRDNPAAFTEFKRARRLRTVVIALDVCAIFSLSYALVSGTQTEFWVGTVTTGLLLGSGIAINEGAYSNSVLKTIQLYNQQLPAKQ